MISRLTAFAAAFAVLATTSLAIAASAHQGPRVTPIEAKPVRSVQLERVVIVGKRLSPEAR